jgi:uncharacterized membrane protein YqjE
MNAPNETMTARGILPLLVSMFGARLELASIDVEAHLQATLAVLMTAFVAVVLGLVAFTFIGIAVIVFFWETHRIAAAACVTGAYVALALLMALRARSGWSNRPAAFAATIAELERDADAFRGRP